MAVSIVTRPFGYVLKDASTLVMLSDSNPAIFTDDANVLSTGDFVYIDSEVAEYNGFKYVDLLNTNSFNIRPSATEDRVEFIRQLTEEFPYLVAAHTHNWNCVHLPIVYKLSNTLWPVNSSDTARTISVIDNSEGYCSLNISGDIKTTGSATELDFVKITGASDSTLDGVYQIITYVSDTSFVIDLAYSTATDSALAGATIQYYYNNYCVKVRVYGGLPSGHQHETVNTTTLIAELRLTPDDDNIVKFSVHEFLKGEINIRDKATLGTLPNNIDFWTSFYITYAESYDTSDGTDLSSFTSSYTSDLSSFLGYAANAKLPFKNIHSGSLSDYISGPEASFLTLFERPVIFPRFPFSISTINYFTDLQAIILREKYYLNGVLQATTNTTFSGTEDNPGQDVGLYRFFLSDPSCNYDRVDVMLIATPDDFPTLDEFTNVGGGTSWTDTGTTSPTVSPSAISLGALSTFANTGDGVSWTTGASPSVTLNLTSSKILYKAFAPPRGESYHFDGTYSTGGAINASVWVVMMDASFNLVQRVQSTVVGTGAQTISLDITTPKNVDVAYIGFYIIDLTSGSQTYTLTAFSVVAKRLSKMIVAPYTAIAGVAYTIGYDITVSATYSGKVKVKLLGDGYNEISTAQNTHSGAAGPISSTVVITADSNAKYIGIVIEDDNGDSWEITSFTLNSNTDPQITETKTIDINCDCANQGIYISWLNYLGGFDSWYFTAEKDYLISIGENGIRQENILPSWPESYGEFADTITSQTFRDSTNEIVVRSQYLTVSQLNAIKYIKTSPLVCIINSRSDRRVVLIDQDSFKVYSDGDKLFSIEFKATYTDNIPSQTI
jgi:hypothetical protein